MASSPGTAPPTDSPPSPPPSSSPSPPSPDASPPPSESDAPPPSPNASPPPPGATPPPPSATPPPPGATPPLPGATPPPPGATPPPPSATPPPSGATPPPPDTTPPPQGATPSPPPAPSNDSSPPSPQNSSPPPPQNSPPSPPTPPSNNNSPPSPPPPSRSRRSPPSPNAVPPPPPRRSPSSSGALAPPQGTSSSGSTSSSSSDDLGVIVGATVGAAVVLIALILICVTCAKRKKKRNQQPSKAMQYPSNPSGKDGDNYYNSSQQSNWHNSRQSVDHVVKLQQPSGAMGPPGGGWPPPPPPMISSGDMSSNYSGPRHPPLPPPSPNLALGFNKSTFTYEELAAATGGFSQANLLGQGGFGYVHKGVLPNGKEIAVKSLKSGSGQGEREFQAEVEIISRVHHRHLVSLVGYCIASGQRMLVYEFVPNKTLEHHLHGSGRPIMDWPSRIRIALGSAKGLAYLHEDCHPKIIHRDIKTANILLDYNFEAMVADFGLAKLSTDNYTHVSTRVMGTFGYLAPEYASSGKLTEKSDVFSYGVMLLELITGRRPVDNANFEDSLVDWARPLLTRALADGNYDELVDRFLENDYDSQEMARMVACAAASIRHSAKRRPKMSQIVRALEGDVSLEDLNDVTKTSQSPAFSSGMSSEYNTRMYNADIEKFKKMALSSQEFESSEDGTSDSGHIQSSSDTSQEMTHR